MNYIQQKFFKHEFTLLKQNEDHYQVISNENDDTFIIKLCNDANIHIKLSRAHPFESPLLIKIESVDNDFINEFSYQYTLYTSGWSPAIKLFTIVLHILSSMELTY